ncbi:discoidin domain-containing protein [Bacteroidales bacterium]|nr:discoidin domain-containing protein [Bacteroidales bacterium]
MNRFLHLVVAMAMTTFLFGANPDLINNGDYEQEIGWDLFDLRNVKWGGTGTHEWTDSIAHSGTYSNSIHVEVAHSNWTAMSIAQKFYCTNGAKYTLSAWVRSDSAGANVQLSFTRPDNSIGWWGKSAVHTLADSDTWYHISNTWEIPVDKDSAAIGINLSNLANTGATIWIDDVSLIRENVNVKAIAGNDQNVTCSDPVTLTASKSELEPDSTIIINWIIPSGITINETVNDTTITFTAPTGASGTSDTYEFYLDISDGSAIHDTDTIAINVLNTETIANAGDDIITQSGKIIILDGSTSTAACGATLNYQWTSENDALSIIDASTATPSITLPVITSDTIFAIELVVNDGANDSDPDMMYIKVKAATLMLDTLCRNSWEVIGTNSDNGSPEAPSIDNLLDGDTLTNWTTDYDGDNQTYPFFVSIDMRRAAYLSALSFTPRKRWGANGTISEYRIYVSHDSTNWGEPVADSSIAWPELTDDNSNTAFRAITALPIPNGAVGRYIKLVIDNAIVSAEGGPQVVISELNAIGKYVLDRSNWSTVAISNGTVNESALDGVTGTMLGTDWKNPPADWPISIEFKLDSATQLEGFVYTPRQDQWGPNGVVQKWELQTSTNGTEYHKVGEGTFDYPSDPDKNNVKYRQVVMLDSTVPAHYVKLISKGAVTSPIEMGCAEFNAIGELTLSSSGWIGISATQLPEKLPLAIDGNPLTMYSSDWQNAPDDFPMHIAYNMKKEIYVESVVYTPRQDQWGPNGTAKSYEIYVSMDGNNWGSPVAKGKTSYPLNPAADAVKYSETISLDEPTLGRYIKFSIIKAVTNPIEFTCAEIAVNGFVNPAAKDGIKEISIKEKNVTVYVGDSTLLTCAIAPVDSANATIKWTSGDENIATVDATGKVIGISNGEATITATAISAGLSNSVTITVETAPNFVNSITLDIHEITLSVNEAYTFSAIINPNNAYDTTYFIKSLDRNIAEFNLSSNTMVAKDGGTVKVVAQSLGKDKNNNYVTDTCIVTVRMPVNSITLDKRRLTLDIDSIYVLMPEILPANAFNSNYVLTSSDSSIVNIIAGTDSIIALASGKVTITATTIGKHVSGQTLSTSCSVTVPEIVGINSNQAKHGLYLYPNPALGNNVTIQVKENIANARLQIFNINGQLVGAEIISGSTTHKLQSDLKSGVYLLNVSTNNNTYVERLIIK